MMKVEAIMAKPDSGSPENHPVYVYESIPAGWSHEVTEEQIANEWIPAPKHLRILPELARGGMGRIHVVTDRNLLRNVAMKRLDKQFVSHDVYREGFIAEAQMTGQLEHPNIVPVHELAVNENGVPYFTMKLINGVNLQQWMRQPDHCVGSSKRLLEGLDIFVKVCDAMAYAHHRGVVHRDIKPENIMVGEFGQVYLMDWGLARLTKTSPASGADSQMNITGPVGTAEFMSPEQAAGDPSKMDERSDVFGLGAVLYEIISGRTPYGDFRNPAAIIAKAKKGKVTPLADESGALGLSPHLANIVNRAVAAKPEHRYQSVLELQADVREFIRGGMYLPRQRYHAGSTIIREGERGDAAYLIVSGQCRAYHTTQKGQETLATMGQGDVFGEMALLLDETRAATVEAVDDVTVLVLDKRTMDEGLGIDGWTGALVKALAGRFRDLEQQVRKSNMRNTLPPDSPSSGDE